MELLSKVRRSTYVILRTGYEVHCQQLAELETARA